LGHQLLQLRLALEIALQVLLLEPQRLLLLANPHYLELREMPQPRVEYLLCLLVGELETLHQDRLGLVLAANDANDLVEIEERDHEAVEDMQAPRDLVE